MLTKEQAIEKFHRQIRVISELRKQSGFSPEFTKWKRDTEVLIQNTFGEESRHTKDFTGIRFSLMIATNLTPDSAWREAYRKGLDTSESILNSFIDEVEEYWHDKSVSAVRDSLSIVEQFCNRFHLLVKQLGSRRENRETLNVNDEYDVQDLLHSVLTLEFDDIRPEEWTPSYAGGSSRVDFLLKQEQIVIEVKKTRDRLKGKEIGDQLIIDIGRYQSHPDCKSLICFIYDPDGHIANPRGFENDLNMHRDDMMVKVIITPKWG
jgi:predicted house-cleaning noncanonical NTP pyrophosphatase (MazG superfamily)